MPLVRLSDELETETSGRILPHKAMVNLRELKEDIFQEAFKTEWEPDPEYSVFNQMDHSWYDSQRAEFVYKYRVLRAIAKVLEPKTITELGTCAGSAVDAYHAGFSGIKHYTGYDLFPVVIHEDTGQEWSTEERARLLLEDRGIEHDLIKGNLRNVKEVKGADLISVDAAHCYRDGYRDLRLAFHANPAPVFIHVDDAINEVGLAITDAVIDYGSDKIQQIHIDYVHGGGCLLYLQQK